MHGNLSFSLSRNSQHWSWNAGCKLFSYWYSFEFILNMVLTLICVVNLCFNKYLFWLEYTVSNGLRSAAVLGLCQGGGATGGFGTPLKNEVRVRDKQFGILKPLVTLESLFLMSRTVSNNLSYFFMSKSLNLFFHEPL